MDFTPIHLENILEQVPKWTFAGDFTILQWMKQISQDLENRAETTIDSLTKLNNNIKSTNIGLDNVANSLTTLQFGNQFVECRVQDDDETYTNVNNSRGENQNQPEEPNTSKEMLNTFLDNNLKVLRNCYEKYSIDLEDSDDEENSKDKTCIYQPINPYNERPLPFIFGSKDWHSKWHVGLYENGQENCYSGDEISESFSESSSTSHLDDNESFESNTEWASSNSIDNDLNLNIEIKNASSLGESQSLYPVAPVPIHAAESKPTSSSSLVKKDSQASKQSINSINSKNSCKTTTKDSSFNKENTLQSKSQPQKLVDLYTKPSENLDSVISSVSSAQSILNALEDNVTISKETTPALKIQCPPFVDLFAEPLEEMQSPTASSMAFNQNRKRNMINIFDKDEENMDKDDLLSVSSKEDKFEKPAKTNIANKSSIVSKTFKSLFDDSDEDDDFLKAFVKKSSPREVTKTLQFGNEIREPTINSGLLPTSIDNDLKTVSKEKNSNSKIQSIFDDTENDLLFNNTTKDESKILLRTPKLDNSSPSVEASLSNPNLFDKSIVEKNVNNFQKLFNDLEGVSKLDNLSLAIKPKRINLFDDSDDDDDLFSIKPKSKFDVIRETHQHTKVENSSKEVKKESIKILKDVVITKDVNCEKIIKNQLPESCKFEGSDSTPNEEKNKSEETMVFDTTENKVDTESFNVHNEYSAEEKLFEPPKHKNFTLYQKELDTRNAAEITQSKSTSVLQNVTRKPSSSNQYDLNSILFLDEPPEDDKEFFEALARTPNALSSNYNAIDLENEMYEPELPKAPAVSISINQTDPSENFYTGLQLFSDIPPDDDAGGNDTSNHAQDDNQTTRLHSIFYDDFHETLMALNQKQTETEILNHSIFSDEPPPMNEEINSSNRNEPGYKVLEDKRDITCVDHKIENFNKDEEALYETRNTADFSNKRSVSKLQMPHININVKALLPVANNTLLKAKEDAVVKPSLNVPKKYATESNVLEEISRTGATEHILPSITKNRVKILANRRPSTRKARQENYRKSLIEQQQMSENSNENSENENGKNVKTMEAQPRNNINQTSSMEVPKRNPEVTINDIFTENNATNVTLTSAKSNLLHVKHQDENNDDNTNKLNKIININESYDEEDDDFFKYINATKIIDTKGNNRNKFEKSSSETFGENTSSSLAILANNTLTETTKSIQETQSLVAEQCVNLTECEKQHQIQDDENLLNKSHARVSSEFKALNQMATNKLKSFFLDVEDDDDLFQRTLEQPTSLTNNKNRNNKAKSLFKSFLDSDSDGEPIANVLPTKTSILPTTESSTKKTKVSISPPKNTKLFTASDSDSDDLFKKFSSNKTCNLKYSIESLPKIQSQLKTQPQSSLFGDDSDSDGFLTSSDRVSKTISQKNAIKKNVPNTTTQKMTSLFSDLDSDEDDLFGSGIKQVKTKNVTTSCTQVASTPKSTTTSIAEATKLKTVDDNPLSDLL